MVDEQVGKKTSKESLLQVPRQALHHVGVWLGGKGHWQEAAWIDRQLLSAMGLM
jgi:hypothetical protein